MVCCWAGFVFFRARTGSESVVPEFVFWWCRLVVDVACRVPDYAAVSPLTHSERDSLWDVSVACCGLYASKKRPFCHTSHHI